MPVYAFIIFVAIKDLFVSSEFLEFIAINMFKTFFYDYFNMYIIYADIPSSFHPRFLYLFFKQFIILYWFL